MHFSRDKKVGAGCQRRAHAFGPGRIFWCLALLLLARITPLCAEESAVEAYRLGHGLHASGSTLWVGGYMSAKYIDLEKRQAKAEISDLSLFLKWDTQQRWRGFAELEVGEALVFEDDRLSTDDAEFELERLYLDYIYSGWLTIRVGKALTPIGHWNSIHADPLIWTVSRPLTTDSGFSHYITGLSLLGSVFGESGVWEYYAYLDNSDRLDPRPDNRTPTGEVIPGLEIGPFDHAAGLRLSYRPDSGNWRLGFSLARFGIAGFPGVKTLAGIDFNWDVAGANLSGEGLYRADTDEEAGEVAGGFVQAVVPLPALARWYLVSRIERFRDLTVSARVDTLSLGLAWRPSPPVVFKLEARAGDDNDALAPNGVFSSLAVLF